MPILQQLRSLSNNWPNVFIINLLNIHEVDKADTEFETCVEKMNCFKSIVSN